jgi:vacuolar-type H+-ATPase subunit I/STV1
MQQPNGVLQVVGEMVSIVVLALTGRFIGFAQTTLESGVPLTVDRAFSHFTDILSVFTRFGNAGLLLSVLVGAALTRIGIAYANRSVLLGLGDMAGLAEEELSWSQRTVRLPIAIVYRSLSGIATFVGAIALAICFRLFNPENPFGFAELSAYVQSINSGITYGSVGALVVLFALYGIALAIIGYIASPAVLSLEEMASGCRPEKTPIRPKSVGASA